MKKIGYLAFLALVFSMPVFAHTAFTLVSTEKKTVKAADLAALEKNQTIGKKDKANLTFTEKEIRLVVLTGPEDDMLSFRIQGMRNPVLVMPAGARLTILFINVDVDMRHDVRLGHVVGEFPVAPEIAETAGSTKLVAKVDDATIQAEEMVIKANDTGIFKYFCSVRGHAKDGMWGHVAIGVPPGNLKQPPKTKHVHSEDEDHAKPTTPKKPGEEMPGMKPGDMPGMKPGEKHDMPGMTKDHDMRMSSTVNIGDPMEREASGTSWAPDSSPVYAKMKMYEDGGMLMLMGTGFLRYTSIGSSRDVSASGEGGRSRVDAPTMFMAMYARPVGEKAQIGFRGMFSLDPAIERGYGYPLLYQSGEQFRGRPLHDRQHPHDLVSELAVTYSYKFDDKKSFFLYAGIPGEPALGPPMYLHRVSGMNNPDAPIGHHWQDATHITYGVVTAGFSFGKAKIETSAFNGREPDENRWNFDRPRLNSFSGRFSFNPTKDLAFQISHGYLRDPEPLEPEIRILRKTTASAIYNKKLDENRNWASTVVWGQNYANGERSNSFLVESNCDFFKNAVFARFETVKKSGHDLVLAPPFDDHDQFWVQAFSIGYVRDIVQGKGLDVGIGGMATINHNPSALAPVYGGTTHGGWQVFLRFRPSRTKH
jgi:hypothetical protein